MSDEQCCHGECRQGRDCPKRAEMPSDIIEWLRLHAPLTLQKYLTKDTNVKD
jgi:hypothetical protein